MMAKLRRLVISESGAWYVDSDEKVDCFNPTDRLANVLLPVVPVKASAVSANSDVNISKDFIVIICGCLSNWNRSNLERIRCVFCRSKMARLFKEKSASFRGRQKTHFLMSLVRD
jgi:hypothetical protein